MVQDISIPENADSVAVPPPSKKIPFWTENPNVLFQSEYLFEFFPVESMTYSQKINAISRVVLLVGILLLIWTRNPNVILVAAATLGSIALVYFHHTSRNKGSADASSREGDKESFQTSPGNLATYTLEQEKIQLNPNLFDQSTPNNPFSNVLLTDYEYNPQKKPAPASYNEEKRVDILSQAKAFVQTANPDQPEIAEKLFKDLGEELQFEQSMRPFYSNPATTVPNDQQAFADFCYGSMISCKEGNMFACSRKYQTANN